MAGDVGLENLFGFGQPLNVIDVGVRGDQGLAFTEREIKLANEIDHIVDGVFVADVEQRPLLVIVN